ncbi:MULTISPECIES: hypothetical protein [Vibrio diabolicus subgroup]|uniref:hypothetical protein n=1 Tax=Vibrio diabolicus subgroup TaxID=2315253 RepID=UPI0015F3921F|nr:MULTISPECIES: hypothetical protein [Vibrio diabolicus subgroup]MCR9546087.1 hypothetical protein [Vibrio antiquarius]MCR9847461.1 hypothetical protein [Vibrio antiquarius]MCR9911827.1 hypothetical protein [Vibrio antiquarius]MCR9936018.1 hypothetical protein [Vibrio antiquarius]MCS0438359.1 hypothetical protein [Vibrio diabolicus]
MTTDKFQCLSKRNRVKRNSCLKKIEENEVDIYVLDSRGLVDLWIFEKRFKGLSEEQVKDLAASMKVAEFVSSRGSLLHDVAAFYILAEDLHKGGTIIGKYEITRNGSKSYITFKGNHRLRSIVKGTRYLLNNANILALGIGQAGLKASAKGGVFLTIIYSVPYRTLELAFKKDYLFSNWVVNVSSDVIKASISATIGYLAGAYFIGATGVVLLPIGVGIVAALVVGEVLSSLEGKLELKEKAIAAIDEHFEKRAKQAIDDVNEDIVRRKSISQLQRATTKAIFL